MNKEGEEKEMALSL